ncbi:hypothetical protein BDW59DRAFT_154055 [Aspergillus cavernicola]|uniref:Uncharacterized protein n=1 Tax=Aspergillus cavernicola TaxID=176166 RepID=A0ABR4HI85_9EURO
MYSWSIRLAGISLRLLEMHIMVRPQWVSMSLDKCPREAMHQRTSAIVIDSSMLVRNHAHFLPTMRSYMGTTFNSLRGRKSPKNSIYHLTPYMEYLLRISLAAIKNSHSCTDMGCKAMPRTWQELQSLSRLLRANLISIQQLLVREGLDPSAISSEPINRLLSDSMTVAENAVAHTASIERQAQLQTSELAAREAEETYKQARSMEKLTTIAWIYIPLSFSATFFGMNVAQLNDSGPNIGYFFLLLIISLLIAACTAILYTDWWREVTLAWRAWVQPGHDCHPRELGVAHLLWITVHWAAKKIFCILGMRKKKKKRESDPDDGSELS